MVQRGIFTVILCLLLSFGSVPTAFADEQNAIKNNGEKILVDETTALEMGERFFASLEPDLELTSVDAIKFYNTEGQATGYVVHVCCEGREYGYVVFDAENEYGISEFSYGAEATSPYESVFERSDTTLSESSEDKLYKLDDLTYGIVNKDTGRGFDNYGEEISAETDDIEVISEASSSSKPDSWNAIFLDVATVYRDYNVTGGNSLSNYRTFSEGVCASTVGRYACGVTAMMTVCSYYTDTGDLATSYNDLWNRSGTWVDEVKPNGVEYGWTTNNRLGPAVV